MVLIHMFYIHEQNKNSYFFLLVYLFLGGGGSIKGCYPRNPFCFGDALNNHVENFMVLHFMCASPFVNCFFLIKVYSLILQEEF